MWLILNANVRSSIIDIINGYVLGRRSIFIEVIWSYMQKTMISKKLINIFFEQWNFYYQWLIYIACLKLWWPSLTIMAILSPEFKKFAALFFNKDKNEDHKQ